MPPTRMARSPRTRSRRGPDRGDWPATGDASRGARDRRMNWVRRLPARWQQHGADRRAATNTVDLVVAEVRFNGHRRLDEVARDRPEREQPEPPARDPEERPVPAPEPDLLQALMDHLPDIIYVKDADSRFVRLNRALADFFGL